MRIWSPIFAFTIVFLLGLFSGYAVFRHIVPAESMSCVYGKVSLNYLSYLILLKNLQFAILLFLLGFSRVAQLIVLYLAGFVSGMLVSHLSFLMLLVSIVPHGIPEILGYSLLALAGYEYFRHEKVNLSVILIGLVLVVVAFFIEMAVTPRLVNAVSLSCVTNN